MVRLSRKYHSGKWTLPLLAWCTSADPAQHSGAQGREKYTGPTAPSLRGSIYFKRQKNWQVGRRRVRAESELSDRQTFRRSYTTSSWHTCSVSGENTFGFLAQIDLGRARAGVEGISHSWQPLIRARNSCLSVIGFGGKAIHVQNSMCILPFQLTAPVQFPPKVGV